MHRFIKMRIPLKIAITLFLGVVLGISTNFIHSYRGDGDFVDRGLFLLTERYRIDFDEFEFCGDQLTKVYSFTGVPKDVMTLQIKVNPVENDTRQAFDFFPLVNSIRPYHPKANVILLENNEKYVLIRNSLLFEEWIVSHWSLWHSKFTDIEFYPRAKYKLIFSALKPKNYLTQL